MSKILSAFITFDCTHGYEEALELGKSKNLDFKFLGYHPRFKKAETP
jgi:hypothetical protein